MTFSAASIGQCVDTIAQEALVNKDSWRPVLIGLLATWKNLNTLNVNYARDRPGNRACSTFLATLAH